MNIILLEKVRNLGMLGDQVTVKPGYARNYLIPQRKAVFASAQNIELFEARRAELEKTEQENLSKAQQRAEQLAELSVTLACRAGDEGKLYGSIGTTDLAEAISAAGVEVQKREVRLPQGPIRHTGGHTVTLHLHSDVNVDIIVNVTPE